MVGKLINKRPQAKEILNLNKESAFIGYDDKRIFFEYKETLNSFVLCTIVENQVYIESIDTSKNTYLNENILNGRVSLASGDILQFNTSDKYMFVSNIYKRVSKEDIVWSENELKELLQMIKNETLPPNIDPMEVLISVAKKMDSLEGVVLAASIDIPEIDISYYIKDKLY